MDYNPAQTAATNTYAPKAPEIRDASLRNKADETSAYLTNAHALLDELEDALHGPHPRERGEPSVVPAGHPGLRDVLGRNSESSATLVSRIGTLLSSL